MTDIIVHDGTRQIQDPGPNISLEVFEFEHVGPDDDPTASLLATLMFGGVHHHVEAYAVTAHDDGVQRAAHSLFDDNIDQVYDAIGGDGPWRTVDINGREYVIIVTPFCT